MNSPIEEQQLGEDAKEWIRLSVEAWGHAAAGRIEESLECYRKADNITREVQHTAELSILRHSHGSAKGFVKSASPTEDRIISLTWKAFTPEAPHAAGFASMQLEDMSESINRLMDVCEYAPHHTDNITVELPHLQVLSTGRCGTIALYHLLEQANYLPYHTYLFMMPADLRQEMACRIISGDFSSNIPVEAWIESKAAEWLGAISMGLPMAALNHLDTVFAPIFAAVHRKSKFIYLHRDPIKTFDSFFAKNQWSIAQINPVYYTMDPFRWKLRSYDTPIAIAWYIRWTEVFCESFGRVMGDRFIKISADKLFNQDKEEICALKTFADLWLSEDEIKNHYTVPYNQKRHKVSYTDDQMSNARDQFIDAYINFGGEM